MFKHQSRPRITIAVALVALMLFLVGPGDWVGRKIVAE